MSRRWIVTGGSRGVGLAVAKAAASRGDRVAVFARKIDQAALAAELGPQCLAIPTDISDRASVDASVARVIEAWDGHPARIHVPAMDTVEDRVAVLLRELRRSDIDI